MAVSDVLFQIGLFGSATIYGGGPLRTGCRYVRTDPNLLAAGVRWTSLYVPTVGAEWWRLGPWTPDCPTFWNHAGMQHRDDVLLYWGRLCLDLNVEYCRYQEDRVKGANGRVQDRVFVNSAGCCRVITRDIKQTVGPFFVPEDEGMEKCKHLFPLNMLSLVGAVMRRF